MKAIDLAGLKLSIVGDRGAVRYAVERAFRLCPTSSSTETICMNIEEGDEHFVQRKIPSWLMQKIKTQKPIPYATVFYSPHKKPAVVIQDRLTLLCIFLSSRRHIQLISSKPTHTYATFCIEELLFPFFRELFIANKKLFLHGAGVVCPRGVGLAFIAEACGGKSTSVLSLLRKGAKILSDDLIVVDILPEAITAAGIPEYINISKQMMASFDNLAKGVVPPSRKLSYHKHNPDSDPKTKVDIQAIYGPDCFIKKSRLDVIYFVNVNREGPFVEPIEPSKALGRLIKANTFARGQILSDKGASLIFDLISRTKMYLLYTGADPVIMGDWLFDSHSGHAAGEY